MKIIDVHAHVYPDTIAQRAADSIGVFYDIPMHLNGTVHELLVSGEAAGIAQHVVCSAAVTPSRVRSVNDYLIGVSQAYPEKFITFGTMHVEFEDVEKELDRIKAAGLKGVKLHPDFQHFCLDDEKAIAMFQAMAERNLPALIHTGDQRYPYSEPARMARVLDAVPNLKAICAHLGGWSVWNEAWRTLAGRPGVWVDTSSSLYAIKPEDAAEVIRHYGVDRVFFGTDYPMWNPAEEVQKFLRLPLNAEEQEKILHLNFEKFLSELD